MHIRIFGFLLFLLSGIACPGQNSNKAFIESLAHSLGKNYVLEDKAAAMKSYLLEQLEKGKYAQLEGGVLAKTLHQDLQAFSGDRHLAIIHPSLRNERPLAEPRPIPEYPFGLSKAKALEPGIAYLEITEFPGLNHSWKEFVREQVQYLSQFDHIIFDLRNNGGGAPEGVQWLCSYFFPADTNLLLNSLYIRNRDLQEDFYVLKEPRGPRLTRQKLYILTSDFTFSAGEEFTYNLQQLKRAIIVGESTGGGAHPIFPYDFEGGFAAIIPVARAINPISKGNWEGEGVQPDIKIAEEKALAYILEMIKNQD